MDACDVQAVSLAEALDAGTDERDPRGYPG